MNKNTLILLICARFFDIITTYISRNGDLSGEMNIIVRKFGLGWEALIISEILLLLLVFILCKKIKKVDDIDLFNNIPKEISFKEFMGQIYFNKKINFLELFHSKVNKKVFINDLVCFTVSMLIIVSVLVGINNLLSSYGVINFFTLNNEFIDHNFPKILNIIIFTIIVIYVNLNRYNKFKKN